MAYTSSQILASVKRNQTIVSSTFRFTDDDLYAMINEEAGMDWHSAMTRRNYMLPVAITTELKFFQLRTKN